MQGIKAGAYIGSNGLFDSATVNAYRASIKGLSATQAEAALSASGLNAAQRQQILTSKESTVANAGQATSFNVLTKAVWANVKAMAKWLVTTPTGWITLAIGATVGLISAYNNVEKKQNELIENARNLQEEYRSFAKDTAGKITSLEGQAEEFNKLSKGVDKYGNNISLASDEYDRYKSIVAEILGYSPELIQGYDAEGNAIADKNGLLERSIELLKEEQRLKLKEMTTDEKTGEAYDAAEAVWQQVQGYEGANTRNQIARWFDDNALRGGVNYEVDIAKVLGIKDEWKEEGNNLQNAIINNIDTVVKNIKDKKAELLAISDGDGNAIFSVDEIDSMIDLSNDWQYAYNQWQQDIEDAKHGMDDQFDLYAQRAKSYNDLTDAQKVFVNEYIRATGDITDAEGHLLSENKILEKAKGYEKFVNEFAELNKLGEGGSVDLTFRPEIDTEELNKKGWEAGEGFATVFSSAISNTDFDDLIPENAEDTVAINFTPIIVDPNTGEFKGVLSEEELYAYAHDVLAGVREDDLNLQIGAKFEGKDAIDKAVADGERIHYLHEKLFINNDTVDSWEELRKVLVKTGDDAVQAGENANKMTVSLSKTADKIKELYSFIKELDDDGLSPDSIEKIISDYPELIGYIGDEARLRTELKKKIAEEENKYKQALRNKVMASSSFAELVESKNQELFKELGLAYNKDTQKFELESRRKAAIAIKDATTAAKAWAQIYADEQVLSAPDYSKDLHDSGKNSKYRDKNGNWYFETYNDGKLKTWTYEAGSSMAKILDSQRELANITNFDIDFGDDSSSKDSYEDLYDEFLETLEQEVENLDESIERINTKLEHAIKTGNAEQIQILSKELDDAYKQKKALLESKANEARTQLALIMEEIYAIAPQLTGKSINEITPYEIEAISMSLGDASDKWDSITKSAQNYYETISEWSDEWWANEEDKLSNTEEYYNTLLDEIDRYVERIEDSYDEQSKALDKQITKEEALLKIKQGQYDATNNLKEAQKDIDKEIANSRNSKEYLSDYEYERIFGEADYEYLSGEIRKIGSEINGISANFYKQIEDAYKNDQLYLVEAITAEYERQVAMKERELEIAQAKVDLEKKRLTLENAKAERNIKQYSENGVTWVADQEKVKQAQEDLIDAQAEIKDLQRKSAQQIELDRRQANIDMLNSQKESFDYQLELLNKSTEKLKESIENVTDPLADLGVILQTLVNDTNTSISNSAQEVASGIGSVSSGSFGSGYSTGEYVPTAKTTNYDGTQNYTDASNIISINGQLFDKSQTDSNGLAKPIENATMVGGFDPKKVYDSGGIASGKGIMLKAVDEEETVLPPWLTKEVLTPEYNENFDKLLKNMQLVNQFNPLDFIVKPQIPSLINNMAAQPSVTNHWSGDMHVDGGDPNEILRVLQKVFNKVKLQ